MNLSKKISSLLLAGTMLVAGSAVAFADSPVNQSEDVNLYFKTSDLSDMLGKYMIESDYFDEYSIKYQLPTYGDIKQTRNTDVNEFTKLSGKDNDGIVEVDLYKDGEKIKTIEKNVKMITTENITVEFDEHYIKNLGQYRVNGEFYDEYSVGYQLSDETYKETNRTPINEFTKLSGKDNDGIVYISLYKNDKLMERVTLEVK
ncbi:MAG: hypothetical protein N4A54_00435 [Peptostreptococcaceae bacterium]|jgi:hypothetical protein|nr:hypothetical protein [Peptostreptococcaceae bacterium]